MFSRNILTVHPEVESTEGAVHIVVVVVVAASSNNCGVCTGGWSPGSDPSGGVSPGGVSPGGVSPGGVSPGGVSPGGVSSGWEPSGGVSSGVVELEMVVEVVGAGVVVTTEHADWANSVFVANLRIGCSCKQKNG